MKKNINPEIVIHIGVIGSGKGYQCELLKSKGYVQIDFADALRDMAWGILNWSPINDHEYDLFKKGLVNIPLFGKVNGRVFLQNIGSYMRSKDTDYWCGEWISKVKENIDAGNNVCCSDARFLNEVLIVKNNIENVRFVFTNYKSERYDCTNSHESESLAQQLCKRYEDLQEIVF